MFQNFQQRASAIVRSTIGDLTNHDVVIEAVPFRQANGQQLQQRRHIETAEQSHHGRSLPDWPMRSISRASCSPSGPSSLTISTMRSHSSRRMQRKKRSARCSTAACEVRAQNLKQVGWKLRQMHRFFDELGQAIFHANAGAQFGRQHRALLRDVFHGEQTSLRGGKLLAISSF